MRGRRFVRPALILSDAAGEEHRVLAELDDKPWAAEDGEPWQAAFLLDAPLTDVAGIELSVAPDINVPLRSRGREPGEGPIPATGRPEALDAHATQAKQAPSAEPTETSSASEPRPERPRASAREPRPTPARGRAPDPERLTARVQAAEAGLERERARRAEAEQALERPLGEVRRLSAEVARLGAELELARAAEREAAETTTLLDAARRDSHALRARYEALSAEHARILGSEAQLREDLDARSATLASTREALSTARTARTESEAHAAKEARAASQARAATGSAHAEPHALGTHARTAGLTPVRTDRPLNPSLSSSRWLMRLLVVLVLAGVLVAIYVVLHSTVLH